jgi:hypothetical protein
LLQDATDIEYFGKLTDDFIIAFIRNYNKDDRLCDATKLISRVSRNEDLYVHISDSSQSVIQNLEQATFCETRWGLHKNPSDPIHFASYQVPFHRNGVLIKPNGEIHRLFSRT